MTSLNESSSDKWFFKTVSIWLSKAHGCGSAGLFKALMFFALATVSNKVVLLPSKELDGISAMGMFITYALLCGPLPVLLNAVLSCPRIPQVLKVVREIPFHPSLIAKLHYSINTSIMQT